MIDLNRIYALEMMRKRRIAQSTGYRTEDLALHLDGVQNTRAGTHNPSATVWEDLAGNMDVTLYNATWGSDHVAFTGDDNSHGAGSWSGFSKGCTLEVVFKRNNAKATVGLIGWGGLGTYLAQIWIRTTQQVAGRAIDTYHQHTRILTGGEFLHAGFSYGLAILNGAVESNSITWSAPVVYPAFKLGIFGSNGDGYLAGTGFPGNNYAVRVYDANLTAEELYAHWLIDKARFNIPEE